MLKLTDTLDIPDKPRQALFPGLQSLVACALTYLHAAMCTLQCQNRVRSDEVR